MRSLDSNLSRWLSAPPFGPVSFQVEGKQRPSRVPHVSILRPGISLRFAPFTMLFPVGREATSEGTAACAMINFVKVPACRDD
jgi:hypothetical protein